MENGNKSIKKRFIACYPSNDKPWSNLTVQRKEGYGTSVKGYHRHSYYELNLILSGGVRILTANGSKDAGRGTLILSPPDAPHYVKCDDGTLYKRVYLMFTHEFVSKDFDGWREFSPLFDGGVGILTLSEEEISEYLDIIRRIEKEGVSLPSKMLIYYLLSLLVTRSEGSPKFGELVPNYLLKSMTYIEEHLDERITAEDLAKKFHIGRTTLMTGFKKYTRLTVGEYTDLCRLERASSLLSSGETVEYAALRCGFSDTGGLIRLFKRYYGVSPLKYIKKINK